MKILEVITLGEIGGAQTVLVDLIKGFAQANPDVEIDVFLGPGEYIPDALRNRFHGNIIQTPFLVRKIAPSKDLRAFIQLFNLCRTAKYDIVHCHSSKAALLGRIAASMAGVPKVYVTVHGLPFCSETSQMARRIYRTIEKALIFMKASYIFVSPADLAEMNSMGLNPAKCRLIPNGRPVPGKPLVGLRNILPGLTKESDIVCMIGRLAEVKNPLSFIRIAKAVIKKYPETLPAPHFVLIGEGPLRGLCEKTIREAGMSNWVHLPGAIENAGQHLWDSELVVMTSAYEACPLVGIEAMATGTPVVASNVGGMRNVVKHGQTGFLFSLNNEEEAADYIIRLLQDKPLFERLSRDCLTHYQANFKVERMVNAYAKIFGLRECFNYDQG